MEGPHINILIRTTGTRPSLKIALDSIKYQTYRNYSILIGSEMQGYDLILRQKKSLGKYFYNDYCNTLKRTPLKEGFFFFLDDDDTLKSPDSLAKIASKLEGDGIVCQMLRGNKVLKPTNEQIDEKIIKSGSIGMPCLVLNTVHANLVNITSVSNGDYIWIKECNKRLNLKFVKEVLVHTYSRSYGKK